ncbi:MAG: NAD(P)H-dependent oxidoreductase [Chloroflexi bacterium]|nr:NAD(P)H-dependent oxidoreductase [Chloroflexota bacterium]
MKALALVVSARERGNCYDFAEFMLERLKRQGVEGELINFYDYQITPCQRCSYECVARFDPRRGADEVCPIEDDVRKIWEKTWSADILLLFLPTYGGLPPAMWVAFSQRQQAFFRQAPLEKMKKTVVSAVVLASPHWASAGEWTPAIVACEVKDMGRVVAGFEVINNAGFKTDNLFGGLINEEEIQRRLLFLADRTLEVAREIAGEKLEK